MSFTHDKEVVSNSFYLPLSQYNKEKTSWNALISNFGKILHNQILEMAWKYLLNHKQILLEAFFYAVHTSLFTYDGYGNVTCTFCERWCPLINILHTLIEELLISLWDLCRLGGLLIHGTFHNEVIPFAKRFLEVDDERISILPQSCKYLFFILANL